tara:strand:- start:906 stop:2042 length:1137 start_codon:yes stop_codon:yes gene_type:complete
MSLSPNSRPRPGSRDDYDNTPRITQQGFQENMSAPFQYNPDNKDAALKNKQIGTVAEHGKFQVNQAIERRGGLRFNYAPLSDSANGRTHWLPFFENPTIVESRKSNYAKTNIFLRNEPVRLYTGSDARKFKVDIHYSLVHMASMISTPQMFNLFSNNPGGQGSLTNDEIEAIKGYLLDTLRRDTGSLGDLPINQANLDYINRSNVLDGPFGGGLGGQPAGFVNKIPTDFWNYGVLHIMRTSNQWQRLHSLLHFIINDIRNSVMSTASQPVKGPPIVDLKWGTMYDFVPCIVTDYRLQPVEDAGYDTKSLTAQRLRVSLSLEEFRNINGNLWGNPEVGGDLPGWDSVLDLGTMDPGLSPHEINRMDSNITQFKQATEEF